MTIDEILAERDKAKAKLIACASSVGTTLDALRRKIPRTDADKADIRSLEDAQLDISRADAELARFTADAIENSATLGAIISALKEVTQALKDKKDDLDHLAGIADTVAAVVAGIETVVAEAAQHLPS